MAELAALTARWRSDLGSWVIPGPIMASVTESPWVLPRQVFARRADRLREAPGGPSYQRAWSALDPAGSLLDVGSGAGAACLPLLDRVSQLTAVDSDQQMLALLAERAAGSGKPASCVAGSWPGVAAQVAAADVVTCHRVLYNVPDPQPFLAELTAHARRKVIVELTAAHPLISLNGLWLHFHGLARPDRPVAADLLAIVTAMGYRPGHERWTRPGGADYATFGELVDVTRRRLCLPPERAADVAQALRAAASDSDSLADIGTSGRDVMTIWWDGGGPGSERAGPPAQPI